MRTSERFHQRVFLMVLTEDGVMGVIKNIVVCHTHILHIVFGAVVKFGKFSKSHSPPELCPQRSKFERQDPPPLPMAA
eukprot:3387331-Amphidinium_carterae.1